MSTLLISSESSLPPNVHGKTRGFLEIEVTRIKFATQRPVQHTQQETTPTTVDFISKNHFKKDHPATTVGPETSIGSQGATAKFIWWGECKNHASSIRIVRAAKGATVNTLNNNNKKKKEDCCLLQQQQQQLRCSKVRYSIQTCLRLFLEYLQTCAPLEISVSANVNNLPLGSAQVRLPAVLLRKFAANYVSASNFEHKSKIYALYAPKHGKKSIKCGEFQLKFKIMFAQNTKQLLQEQLQSTLEKEMKFEGNLKDEAAEGTIFTENSSRKSSKTDEIVEAMKKIDAKLVAYLAGQDIQPKEKQNTLERLQCSSPISQLVGEMVQERFREQQLRIYQRVNAIKMHMEALTLQPAGTKYMELLEEDIKPIFTVECQLSNDLIKDIPRWDLFHIMQFESGQFQSLTQCTRFAQDAQREIHFKPAEPAEKSEVDAANVETKLNFGQLHFCVWWRQPGTCLNEMLGSASFDLEELYQASLLEQCKCLVIKRRNVNMANLYFKIGLQLRRNSNGEMKMLKELKENTVVKECNGDDARDADEEQQSAKQTSEVKEAKEIENTCAGRGEKPSNKAADMKKDSSNNNNPQLENTQFVAETTKVRLLKGYVYTNETRNLTEVKGGEYFLVCRRFWHEQTAVTAMHNAASPTAVAHFKYQEQFSILNDDLFLQRVEKQFLQLELWRKSSADNGNSVEPFGLVRLPLHQYFIAYRDTAITNHLCKGKLPVISIDGWASIVNYETGEISGELKCLLAIGSEEQIENLKESRGLTRQVDAQANSEFFTDLASQFSKDPLQHPAEVAAQVKAKLSQIMTTGSPSKTSENSNNSNTKLKKTSDLLDMLQGALMTPPAASNAADKPQSSGATGSLQSKPLQQANVKSFVFAVDIQRATNLPLNPAIKGKKGSKRNANAAAKQNRFPPNEAPSVYVTFQADEGYGKMFKSHEGLVYATNVVQKSTHPVWQQRFRVAATVDYLYNPQKRFILKIWKKAATDLAQCRLQPTPMEDAIIGFAALDLTVFLQGMHIGGWFNIVDFNGRINGQLEVKCQPLEDVQKLLQSVCPYFAAREPPSMDTFIDQFEKSLELSHLNLGQAIKRKFNELEQISQRLRTRLVDVTGEEFSPEFNLNELDNMEPLPETDRFEDEFEDDLKTPPPEQADLEEDEHKIKMISATPASEDPESQPKQSTKTAAKASQQADAAHQ